jgi:predicted metalloprotease with PDZ domain
MNHLVAGLLCAAVLYNIPTAYASNGDLVRFTIDMTGPSTDTFLVEVDVPRLGRKNNVYQFAATAPGAYQVMDIGRFVADFRAYDARGRQIDVTKIQTNQFRIEQPRKVRRITYKVAETWDTPVRENPVYRMAGSSLEKDHALLNIHTLLGYFQGMQDADMEIGLRHPPGWTVGTALESREGGRLFAPDFDFAVDSPILLGRLSSTTMDIGGKKVEIFTYSKNDLIKSSDLMNEMREVFIATNKFVKGFPIDRYVLLFHFEDQNVGAWEHSYSSEYVLKEAPLEESYVDLINGVAAHEIFHMITPLHLHSEVIRQFNFVTPSPSQHLWLYEGVTEWASDMIQLRGGLITLDEFFDEISERLSVDAHFDRDVSLQQLARTAFTPEGRAQYVNIYYRGALVPLLMDILLLEKSGGQRGLREVVLELTKKYGSERPFSEEEFFDEFVAMTHPEMRLLIDRHIKGTWPLPIKEYFAKLGFQYDPIVYYEDMIPDRGHGIQYDGQQLVVTEVRERSEREGLQEGDTVIAINDINLAMENFPEIVSILQSVEPGDTVTYTVNRPGGPVKLSLSVGERQRSEEHVFRVMENASPQQVALREAWMRKLE